MRTDTRRAVARARALMEVGRWAEAARALTGALAQQPDHTEAHNLLAWCYLEDGQPAPALQVADQTAAADPENGWTHRLRANALRRLGRAPESVAAATLAVRLAPGDALGHLSLGWCLYAADGPGDVERARHHADRALALSPEDPDVHVLDGVIHDRMFRGELAREAFQRALARRPDHPAARRYLARKDLGAGHHHAAAHGFVEAIAARPGGAGGSPYEGDFPEALRGWLWQRFFSMWWLMVVAAVLTWLFGVPRLVGAAAAVAAIGWYGARVRRSLARLPRAARLALPRLLRRPAFAVAPLLTAAAALGMVAALTFPLGSAGHRNLVLLGLVVPVVVVARLLFGIVAHWMSGNPDDRRYVREGTREELQAIRRDWRHAWQEAWQGMRADWRKAWRELKDGSKRG